MEKTNQTHQTHKTEKFDDKKEKQEKDDKKDDKKEKMVVSCSTHKGSTQERCVIRLNDKTQEKELIYSSAQHLNFTNVQNRGEKGGIAMAHEVECAPGTENSLVLNSTDIVLIEGHEFKSDFMKTILSFFQESKRTNSKSFDQELLNFKIKAEQVRLHQPKDKKVIEPIYKYSTIGECFKFYDKSPDPEMSRFTIRECPANCGCGIKHVHFYPHLKHYLQVDQYQNFLVNRMSILLTFLQNVEMIKLRTALINEIVQEPSNKKLLLCLFLLNTPDQKYSNASKIFNIIEDYKKHKYESDLKISQSNSLIKSEKNHSNKSEKNLELVNEIQNINKLILNFIKSNSSSNSKSDLNLKLNLNEKETFNSRFERYQKLLQEFKDENEDFKFDHEMGSCIACMRGTYNNFIEKQQQVCDTIKFLLSNNLIVTETLIKAFSDLKVTSGTNSLIIHQLENVVTSLSCLAFS